MSSQHCRTVPDACTEEGSTEQPDSFAASRGLWTCTGFQATSAGLSGSGRLPSLSPPFMVTQLEPHEFLSGRMTVAKMHQIPDSHPPCRMHEHNFQVRRYRKRKCPRWPSTLLPVTDKGGTEAHASSGIRLHVGTSAGMCFRLARVSSSCRNPQDLWHDR